MYNGSVIEELIYQVKAAERHVAEARFDVRRLPMALMPKMMMEFGPSTPMFVPHLHGSGMESGIYEFEVA